MALHAAGTHPTLAQAFQFVFDACAAQFPNATQNDKIGKMYPLQSQRADFASDVVQNSKNAGFKMDPGKVPTGDSDTLQTVAVAVTTNAVA
jgi:hypothetical protein